MVGVLMVLVTLDWALIRAHLAQLGLGPIGPIWPSGAWDLLGPFGPVGPGTHWAHLAQLGLRPVGWAPLAQLVGPNGLIWPSWPPSGTPWACLAQLGPVDEHVNILHNAICDCTLHCTGAHVPIYRVYQ